MTASGDATPLPAALRVPRYGEASLSDLLPSVLAPLGVPDLAAPLDFAPLDKTVVLLVDGLGLELLRAHPSETPTLSGWLRAGARSLDAGFPTSTAVSVTAVGTGLASGAHGLVGYSMLVPEDGAVLETLQWRAYGRGESLARIRPEVVQPNATLPQRAHAAGVAVVVVSYAVHDGSGLTGAAFRGARYVALPWPDDIDARLAALGDLLGAPGPLVAYTYYPNLDTAAHLEGMPSAAWHGELRRVDELAARLAALLPAGARLLVTGDHGMVDLLPGAAGRVEIAARRELALGVRAVGGEPRMRHLYCEPGAADAVARRWRAALRDDAAVLTAREAVEGGLFGPVVPPAHLGRIGDVLVLAVAPIGVFDSRVAPWETRLIGNHGSLTEAELVVPLLEVVR